MTDKPDTPVLSLGSVRDFWDTVLDEVAGWILPASEIELEEEDGL